MKLVLKREPSGAVNTKGKLYIYDQGVGIWNCDSLELAWRNNERNVSCVPCGTYSMIRYCSPTLGDCLMLINVPNRDFILVHAGNYASSDIKFKTDIKGCILVGDGYGDLNKDGMQEILNSRKTLRELLANFPDSKKYEIEIRGAECLEQ